MNRRDFLQCAALLAAGTTVVPSAWAMNHEQKSFLAGQPNYIDRHPLTFFTDIQRNAVTAIADQIIPLTPDSPGALAAGTPRFIELMVADWFNADEREIFMDGLADLQQRSGNDFAQLPAVAQLKHLEALEEEAGDAAWYQLGNTMRIWDDTAPFICQVKELTVLGFMLSEVGREQFLRENPMGQFKGDVAMGNNPAYAPEIPLRLMTRE